MTKFCDSSPDASNEADRVGNEQHSVGDKSARSSQVQRSSPKRLPPLITLRYFAVAARTGSFATAARRLHVTPAAISHQIKFLEDDIGVELFVRHHRKVTLTPPAKAVLPILEDAFSAIFDAVGQLRAQSENRWVITVCAEPLFASKWLVPRLCDFYRKYPQSEVRLQANINTIDKSKDITITDTTFRKAGIDLSIRLGYGIYPDLDSKKIMLNPVYPVCTPELASKISCQSPEDILNYPLINDNGSSCSQDWFGWQDWIIKMGLMPSKNIKERSYSNSLLALDAAINGHGILLANRNLVKSEIDSEKLVVVFDHEITPRLAYYVVTPVPSLERPIVAAFRNWLVSELEA